MKMLFALSMLMMVPAGAHAAGPVAAPQPEAKPPQILIPETVYPDPLSAAAAFAGNFPESLEGKQKLTITIENNPDNSEQLLATVTQNNVLDDSVQAQQWLIKLVPVTNGWSLAGMTMRSQCARGPDAGKWRVGSCP
ncbi:hypothetical protein [Pontixanthobacter sp. CEM42]|uniref:hypothetical protein n=1 Tax=Pontixanthobacter sp. CEM42 TaxID=2792077 RepID=UPI001ADF1646|nr:hypothetical protein [Pontixanthobacter sp. CEM42]